MADLFSFGCPLQMDNKPELPKMVFDMTPAVAGPKPTMLSPAFATQKSPANSRPDAGKTRGGTPQSVPSSPRILFGAFDQWDGVPPAAADLERDTSLAPPVHEVEAPEDVRYAEAFAPIFVSVGFSLTVVSLSIAAWLPWRRCSATARRTWSTARTAWCTTLRTASTRSSTPSL